MNIDKKFLKDAENETAFSLELYKNKTTGDIEYRSPNGVIVKVADKNGLESLESAVTSLQSAVAGLPASPTTTVVSISSAETNYDDGRPTIPKGILSMGSSPIELLPAPGVGKYYDVEKIIFEFTSGTSAYTFSSDAKVFPLDYIIAASSFTGIDDTVTIVKDNQQNDSGVNKTYSIQVLNSSITLGISGLMATDPILGDGTMRVIITYTERTFGA